MCGLTGFIQTTGQSSLLEKNIKASVETLKRRGPDNQNYILFPKAGLGHARLSIFDLSQAGNQPISDKSGRYHIIFNGEIFNFKDLRSELGLPSSIASDTIVLLEAFLHWKEKCLDKLNGFFVFAIYDSEENSVFIARDRFGIKPLHFAVYNQTLFFASEIKSLFQYPFPKKLNHEALNAFMQLSYVPGDLSIFEGARKLGPGHFLTFKNGELKTHCYYKIESKPSGLSYEDAKSKLNSVVESAVKYWVQSDAPQGAFLSGGVDSSLVVALASKEVKNLKTFSISFPDSPYHDESRFAKIVADRYGTVHTEIPVTTENIYGYVDEVLEYLDEPFADASAIPSFALCHKVGGQVKVALSGDGADEVFGGYEKYRGAWLARKYQPLSPFAEIANPLLRRLPQSRDSKLLDKIRKVAKFSHGLSMSAEERYWAWSSFVQEDVLRQLLKKPVEAAKWQRQIFTDELLNFKDLNAILKRDVNLVLPGDMLTKVDLMSMANSLEVRPVLLDHRVVEMAFSLPDHFKIDANHKKKILVDTFKNYLPEEVYSRPKHGFSVELMPFFKTKYWEKINDVFLNDNLIKEQGIFSPEFISSLKRDLKENKNKDIQPLLWSLIVFQNFYIKYCR